MFLQDALVFYRESSGPGTSGKTVFFLHGSAFDSATWMRLKSVQTLAAAGHKVYAVDLPGDYDTCEPVCVSETS